MTGRHVALWVLRSPRRFWTVVTIAAVTAVAVTGAGIVARVQAGDEARAEGRTVAADGLTPDQRLFAQDPAAATPAPTPQATGNTVDPVDAAEDVAAAWLAGPGEDGTTSTWLAGLRPVTTPDLYATVQTVDPGRVPTGEVTGPGTTTTASDAFTVVEVPATPEPVTVELVDYQGRWVAASVTIP